MQETVKYARRLAAKSLAKLYPMNVHVPYPEEIETAGESRIMYVCIKCTGIMPYKFYKTPCRGWAKISLRHTPGEEAVVALQKKKPQDVKREFFQRAKRGYYLVRYATPSNTFVLYCDGKGNAHIRTLSMPWALLATPENLAVAPQKLLSSMYVKSEAELKKLLKAGA